MPGLAYNGPFIHHVDVNSNHHHGDLFGPEVLDAHWDGLNLPFVQLPNVGALPNFPKKHKACWPAQFQSSWLKIKEQQAKLLSSELSNEKGVKYTSSGESEHNLQAMVVDFMENDSCEIRDSMSDSDNGMTAIDKLCEKLEVLISTTESPDRELLAKVTNVVLAINEDTDLIHSSSEPSECKGSCTRRFVVKYLRSCGYNAAMCKSQWPNSGRVPGGEYEYIDVIFEGDPVSEDRFIVDIDFKAQFQIARPTQHYQAALQALPPIFVGTTAKLVQVLEMMSEAAKCSIKQNCMHLPPWRTIEYMKAKWLSLSAERTSDLPPTSSELQRVSVPCSFHRRGGIQVPISIQTKQCGEQLRRTRALLVEVKMESEIPAATTTTQNKGRANLLRKRPPPK
jgi:uncharacterized protein (TIGR01615 family)